VETEICLPFLGFFLGGGGGKYKKRLKIHEESCSKQAIWSKSIMSEDSKTRQVIQGKA